MNWIATNYDWLIGISIPSILGYMGWRMYKLLWPGRERWSVRYWRKVLREDGRSGIDIDTNASANLQRTLTRQNRLFWRSKTLQQKGDTYQIDLYKERIISGFYELDFESSLAVPLEFSLRFYNRGGDKKTEPNHIARKPITGRGRAWHVEFPPIKVQRIELKITEPNLDENGKLRFWEIYGFELREVMVNIIFLRRFLRRRI